jgi:hypothetical protein
MHSPMTRPAVRLALICIVIGAATASPGHAGQLVAKRTSAGRPARAPRLRAVARLPLRAIKTVWNVDEHVATGYHKAKAAGRRASDRRLAGRIDRRVTSGVRADSLIRVGARRRGKVELSGGDFDALELLGGALIERSAGLTGLEKTTTADDLARAHRVLGVALPALRGHRVRVARSGGLAAMLSEPEVAAAAQDAAPGDRAGFLRDYQATLHTLRAVEANHHVRVYLPGGKGDPELAALAREIGAEHEAFAVMVPLSTPREVITAAQELTAGPFKGVTRVWLDSLMAGKPGSEKRLEDALLRHRKALRAAGKPDDGASEKLRVLTDFRDHGAVRVVPLTRRPAGRRLVRTARRKLVKLSHSVAGPLVRKDFYADARIEGPFKPVLVGMAVANGVDLGAHAAHLENGSFDVFKAVAVDVVDEGGNASQSLLELIKNNAQKVWVDFGVSITVGVGSVVALAAPIGGTSVLARMMDPSTPLIGRILYSAFYGVGSSMSALTMAFLPARHRVKPIMEMVDDGTLERPVGRSGKTLTGPALRRWAARKAVVEHQSYKAQRGSVHGAWGSGVIGGLFGALGWPLKNFTFPLTGGGEGGINGIYQIHSEKKERRGVARRADRELTGRTR